MSEIINWPIAVVRADTTVRFILGLGGIEYVTGAAIFNRYDKPGIGLLNQGGSST